MDLSGKVAMVTGAGSGIGRASALKMAEAGADIVALSMGKDEVEAVATEIEKLGRKVLPIVADVSNAKQMEAAFDKVRAEFGKLDILHSNAGINGVWAPIEDFKVEDWDRVQGVNLRGTFLAVHHAIPLMRKAGGGSMIITSSITGTRTVSFAGSSAYGVTKMGQISFTMSAAQELARYGIRVNAVCPGGISTNIDKSTTMVGLDKIKSSVVYTEGSVPLTKGKSGEADDVANLVLFLASDLSKHITGTPIYVDGGQSLIT